MNGTCAGMNFMHPPHLSNTATLYLVKVKKTKMHVNTTSAFNVNYMIAVALHQITLTVS